nr:MAG TPA: hypothetical protein [Caudoviricetes sp.]DAN83641.1 MAG TPA: hypothetical protein [Caudoviricetes sp.]
MSILKTLRKEPPMLIRFTVSVIRNSLLIMGIILASCFIGRGANTRMKHVLNMQQRHMNRRIRSARW